MKKLLFILLSCCLLICFVSCGDEVESDDMSDTDTVTVTATEPAESESKADTSAESEPVEDNWFDDEEQSLAETDRWTNNH